MTNANKMVDYKSVPEQGTKVTVEAVYDREHALEVIDAALEDYSLVKEELGFSDGGV